MSDDANDTPAGRPKPPSTFARTMLPWAAVLGGAVATFRGATGDLGSIFLIAGPALMALGVVAFFVYRWMEKRGL
jgi:ABC-type sulfate transport system permease component